MTTLLDSLSVLRSKDQSQLGIVFFGGCGEFGANCTGYVSGNRLYLVDCGLMFAEQFHLGVDSIIPNLDKWIEEFGGVEGYIITHGHEDHIGALPFFLERWPAPVYCAGYAGALLRDKLQQRNFTPKHPIEIIEGNNAVTALNDITVEWVPVNHSIPMTYSIVIKSGDLKVFHTGDFKFDPNSLYEPPIDMNRLSKLGKQGIDVLIADSTNALSPGFSPGERDVKIELEKVIDEIPGRIFFSTFSSNLWRIKSVLEIAARKKRKVVISGAGLRKTIRIGVELGFLDELKNIVDEKDVKRHDDSSLLVLVSGCQGEHRSTLARLANDEHSFFKLGESDTLILSSRIIPGNEKSVLRLVNLCARKGVSVISPHTHPGIHVSGHAYQGELVELIKRLKPRFHIPVHGTFLHLYENGALADELPQVEAVHIENGSVLQLSKKGVKDLGVIEIGREFVDSWSHQTMSYENLRERLKIGDSGLLTVAGAFSRQARRWLTKPDITTVGLALPQRIDAEAWKQSAKEAITGLLSSELKGNSTIRDEDLSEAVRVFIRREIGAHLVKKPVVQVHLQFLP